MAPKLCIVTAYMNREQDENVVKKGRQHSLYIFRNFRNLTPFSTFSRYYTFIFCCSLIRATIANWDQIYGYDFTELTHTESDAIDVFPSFDTLRKSVDVRHFLLWLL